MTGEVVLSALLPTEQFIRPLLDRFTAMTGIAVRVMLQDWETAWSEHVRSALYGEGPDVSEVGTTWTGDLMAMEALRPFARHELAEIGPRSALLPGMLSQTGVETDRAWTMPWVAGPRLIFYRPNLLGNSVVSHDAFATVGSFQATLRDLNDAGARWPWIMWPVGPRQIIQQAATWVWAAGGDLLRADGRKTAFASPESLRGFYDYFSLLRYDGDPDRAGVTPDAFFLSQPKAAMRMSGTWLYRAAMAPRPDPGVINAAPLPGPAFFGGSNLVIWKHSRRVDAALELVKFFLRPDVQVEHCQAVGLMPVRTDALAMPPYSNHPFWQVAAEALRGGRTFPAVHMWGLVEDRLSSALFAVAMELRERPEADIRDLLARHLVPLQRRLDLLLREQG